MIIKNDPLKLQEKERKNLSIGITCSGDVHIGFMLTACNAFNYMHQNKSASLDIVVHDMINFELPFGRVIPPLKYKPDQHACHDSAREHTFSEVSDYVSEMLESTDRVKVHYMSDILQDNKFRENLADYISENQIDIRSLYHIRQRTKKVPIKPLCPKCNSSPGRWAKYEQNKLHAKCCDNKYSVDLKDTNVEIETDISLASLRDVLDNDVVPHSDVHFQGGDKIRLPIQGIGLKPVHMTQKVLELSGYQSPDFFIGAQVEYYSNPLSKSINSYFKYSMVKGLSNWQERIYEFSDMTRGKEIIELSHYKRLFE